VVISSEHTEYRWIDPMEAEMYKFKQYRANTVKKSIKTLS